MKITVFGGSSPKPGSAAYQQAYNLGALLARAGHTVATGGYIGTMEAVSRGANEAGGHVVGITCGELEHLRPTGANKWVMEEIHYDTLHQRLGALIDFCDGAFALPGLGLDPPNTVIFIGYPLVECSDYTLFQVQSDFVKLIIDQLILPQHWNKTYHYCLFRAFLEFGNHFYR
jgi:hypothetical protein